MFNSYFPLSKVNKFFIFLSITVSLLLISNYAISATTGVNTFVSVLCDIITLLHGRIGRAIIIFIIIKIGINALKGEMKWQEVLKYCIVIGLFMVPMAVAVMLLPAKVNGISGTIGTKNLDSRKSYTPQELVIASCPQLAY
jgi:type IV secretory pathway VirB2 component (pilin)